jgi:hypothetical protein
MCMAPRSPAMSSILPTGGVACGASRWGRRGIRVVATMLIRRIPGPP